MTKRKLNKAETFEEMEARWKQEKADRKVIVKIWDAITDHTYWPVYRFFNNAPYRTYIKRPLQRAIRGYDDTASWSLDYHFIKVILPPLKELRQDTHGAPSTFVGADATKKERDDGFQAWLDTLDEMIAGFEEAEKMVNGFAIFDTDYAKLPDHMKKHYSDKNTCEIISKEKHDKAFDLFKDNFYALWD